MKLRQLAKQADEIARQGAELLVIAPGTQGDAAKLKEGLNLPFTVLADATGEVVSAYGVPRSLFGLIQRSASIVIDRDGVIRYLRRGINPAQSMVEAEFMDALRSVAAAS